MTVAVPDSRSSPQVRDGQVSGGRRPSSATTFATGSPARGTARSTRPCTSWPSCNCADPAWPRLLRPRQPPARPTPKRCAASNTGCPTWPTRPCSTTSPAHRRRARVGRGVESALPPGHGLHRELCGTTAPDGYCGASRTRRIRGGTRPRVSHRGLNRWPARTPRQSSRLQRGGQVRPRRRRRRAAEPTNQSWPDPIRRRTNREHHAPSSARSSAK